MDNNFWPEPHAFLDIELIEQTNDGRARCTAAAICDAEGKPSQTFYQGQEAHFFYEFEIRDNIGVPCGGLEFHNADGLVIHGKNSYQFDVELPPNVGKGQLLRFHQVIRLDVGPDNYWFSLGFASTDQDTYQKYFSGTIGHEQFAPEVLCLVKDVASFSVGFDQRGKLRHHGVANLTGNSRLTVLPARTSSSVQPQMAKNVEDTYPTIIHVTHWKAGSQWILKILKECAPDRVVRPQLNQAQFLMSPIQIGKIYPTVYVTKSQFDRTHLPQDTRRFVVIRDLRDTLVSAYFSMKVSHQVIKDELSHLRHKLLQLNQEEGMLYMIDNWLPPNAKIQTSWLEANEPLIRYEDLLANDLEILEEVLLVRCQLPMKREQFRQAVINNRFENITAGRARGTEDIQAHERKGVAGDWQSYFTDRIKDVFKTCYDGLLVATGYERDLN